MSLDAAAALMCKLGCFTELLQSRALANVPTDLQSKHEPILIQFLSTASLNQLNMHVTTSERNTCA